MAEVRPFSGLRYTQEAGLLSQLTAPPYDVLSPADREQYAARSPRNIVHATLPEQKADDRSKFVRYARSAALLSEWRREGVLALDSQPAIYRYVQQTKLSRFGDTLERTAVIALLKVEPYEAGVVLPHEQTFPKHKEDRLRILEATRTHLECIFGLYEDADRQVLQTIQNASVGTPVETSSDEGVSHRLEPITDPAAIKAISELLRDRKIWIADGHHRYETAVAFRQALGDRPGPVAEDYLPIALCSLSDPGLALLPTHRIVARAIPRQEAIARLSELFNFEETHSSRLTDGLARGRNEGRRTFAVAFEGGLGYLVSPKDDAHLLSLAGEDGSDRLRGLDVSVLHRVIFEERLGIRGLDDIAYTRDPMEAIRTADQGGGTAFLMNPPTVDDMTAIAASGERMPHKSTYYFPKILSGLVLWSLNDFQP